MQALPETVAGVFRPLLPTLSDEVIVAVSREVDAYRRPMEGRFGRNVRLGVEVALNRFVDLVVGRGAPLDPASRRTYADLGSGEFRHGRSLDALLAAYRVGARIAWRRFADAGTAAGLEPADLFGVGEAIFSYIDELSASSAEGWASAQAAAAGERQRLRRRLVGLLAADPPPDEATLGTAAADAGWRPTPTLAALAVEAGDDEDGALASRLGGEALVATLDGVPVVVVPDPDAPGRRAQLERALAGRGAVLGPSVPVREASRTIARARQALALVRDGVLPAPDGLLVAAEHLPVLVLHADRALASELAARELAPLDALAPSSRAKLLETLRAWLDHRGRVEETAHRLDVHPQTVRYRVNQLRDLLGSGLECPERRHALALALRAAG